MTVVIVDAEERGDLGKEGRHHAALFYADNGMVALSDPCWLQGAFNTLVGLFDRVGLRANYRKTVGMVCHPCKAAGNLSGRPHIHGAVEGTGVLRSVRRVVGGGIPDEPYDDSTWEGDGDTTAMEHPGSGGWALDLQDDLPGEGRPAELPDGGMPGPRGGEDDNVGALTAPACPRHCGYSGGGQLPPPTVRPMQHAGSPAGPER